MRRTISFLAMAIAMTAPAMAIQAEQTDTIRVIDNADQILITHTANNTSIKAMIPNEGATAFKIYEYNVTVEEKADTATGNVISENIFADLPFLTNKKRQRTSGKGRFKSQRYVTACRNIYWGWNFAYNGKSGLKNSFEVGVAEIIAMDWKPWRQGPDFRVGFGFGMKRFLAADNLLFGKNGDRLVLLPAMPDAHDVKAHWDVWTFHLPLMASKKICGPLGVAFGAIVNFNTYSKAWSQQEFEGVRYRETFKGLQQKLLTVELVGIIGLSEGIGIYAKWNPVPVMRPGFGPEFKSWSLGVSLNF